MKQKLIFLAMIALVLCIDLKPVDISSLQNDRIHVSISGDVKIREIMGCHYTHS